MARFSLKTISGPVLWQRAQIILKELRRSGRILKAAFQKFHADNGPFLASGLAYDLLLYSIPLLLVMVSAFGFTFAYSERAVSAAQQFLNQLFPVPERVISDNLSVLVENRRLLGLSGVGLFLFWGSATFTTVRTVLNTVFEVKQRRGFFLGRAVDLVMLLAVTVLLLFTVGVGSLIALLRGLSEQVPLIAPLLSTGWAIASDLLVVLFAAVLFYVLYRFCPGQTLSREPLFIACLAAAVLFEVSRWAFAWYVSVAQNYTVVYGTLGGLVFFFLWLYYGALVFIFAAALGWTIDREIHKAPEGNP